MTDLLGFVIFGGDAFGTVIEVLLFVLVLIVILWLIKSFINRS